MWLLAEMLPFRKSPGFESYNTNVYNVRYKIDLNLEGLISTLQ